jgi:CheY-like chemotaxis protein
VGGRARLQSGGDLAKPVESSRVSPLLSETLAGDNLGSVKLLYLEDDPHDLELLQLVCRHEAPDCEITGASDRTAFIKALEGGQYVGIISDSGVHDLAGPDAVRVARLLAPALPYVFYCGAMAETKRAELASAKPEGIFSKDRPEDLNLAISLLRKLTSGR